MPELTDKQFIEAVYELAFGHDAINRNFGHAEVIEQLEEFNEDSLKWDSIPDDDKKSGKMLFIIRRNYKMRLDSIHIILKEYIEEQKNYNVVGLVMLSITFQLGIIFMMP